MGGAFVSIADDASSLFWNPAGLGFIELPTVYSEISYTIGDVRYQNIQHFLPQNFTLAFPLRGSIIGLGYSIPFEKYREREISWQGLNYKNCTDSHISRITLSIVRKGKHLHLGVNLNYNQSNFIVSTFESWDKGADSYRTEFSGNGLSMDLGAIFGINESISFGIMFGSAAQLQGDEETEYIHCSISGDSILCDTNLSLYERVENYLPFFYRVGVSLTEKLGGRYSIGFTSFHEENGIIYSGMGNRISIEYPRLSAGAEIPVKKWATLRFGLFSTKLWGTADIVIGVTMGGTVRLHGLDISSALEIRGIAKEDYNFSRGIFSISYTFIK